MASALWAVAEGDRAPVTVLTAGGDELTVALSAAGPAANGVSGTRCGSPGRRKWRFGVNGRNGAPLAAVRR